MKTILTFIFIFSMLNAAVFSQPYPVGHRTVTYTDASRSNRSIPCDLYYPGTSAGNNVEAASGTFPLIVFGHGFIMADPDLYSYILQGFAAEGYICVFPTTESSSIFPPPDHLEFGKDLSFLCSFVLSENTNSSSFLFNHVSDKVAVMGHSMGGKAAFIAAGLNAGITTIITMGAAIANPPIGGSSLDVLGQYAVNVNIPCLVLAGEKDCVAPPAQNQSLLYDTVASQCKYYIQIKGGGHCYFASQAGSIIGCESGELTCSMDISRAVQNQIVLNFLRPWLGKYLLDNPAALTTFNDSVVTSPRITYRKACDIYLGIRSGNLNDIIANMANPFSNDLSIAFNPAFNKSCIVSIQDMTGKNVFRTERNPGTDKLVIPASSVKNGIYLISFTGNDFKFVRKIVKSAD